MIHASVEVVVMLESAEPTVHYHTVERSAEEIHVQNMWWKAMDFYLSMGVISREEWFAAEQSGPTLEAVRENTAAGVRVVAVREYRVGRFASRQYRRPGDLPLGFRCHGSWYDRAEVRLTEAEDRNPVIKRWITETLAPCVRGSLVVEVDRA